MARFTLKNILGKKNEAAHLVLGFLEQLKAGVFIEDEKGNLILGTSTTSPVHQHPVLANDELIGWVKGDENAVIISTLLTHLSQKEAEKKKLGSEVLNLYQEVNMIFNFSDKLAQTIGAQDISTITLNEASRVLQSENGVIVLWDEQSRQLKVEAITGELFFDQDKINSQMSVLLKLIISGQSEILSDMFSLIEAGIILPHINSVIYSALKVNHRVMGAIILASNDADRYTAADLKLLTTLALQ